MKSRLLFALVLAHGAAAQAQSSVTPYGLIDNNIAWADKAVSSPAGATMANGATGSRVSVDSGMAQSSRFGFRGREELGGGLAALFILEGGFFADTGAAASSTAVFNRTTVVGLSGGFGTVYVGRKKDFFDEFATYTAFEAVGNMVSGIHRQDRVLGARANNGIYYKSPRWRGLTFNADYGFGEQPGERRAGQTIAAGVTYQAGPLDIGVGYHMSRIAGTAGTQSDSGAGAGCAVARGRAGAICNRLFMVGGKYQQGPWKLYASWSRAEQPLAAAGGERVLFAPVSGGAYTAGGLNNDRTDVYDIGANYALPSGLVLLGSMQKTRVGFVEAPRGSVRQLNLGADYLLSKRTDVYAFVGFQGTSDMYAPGVSVQVNGSVPGADNSQRLVSIGIRHKY